MEDISLFHNYPKKILAFIIKELLDNNFNWKSPYDDAEDNIEIVEKVTAPFGEPISDIDMEFFAKLIEINESISNEISNSPFKKSLYDTLQLPEVEKYEVHWKEYGSCTFKRFFRDTWFSYDENWVESGMNKGNNDGSYEKWSAENDTDYEDFDTYDDTYTSIEKIQNNKTTNESILDKLIKEDTSYAIDSLDRKSLIILKSIIDKKLGL